jgi:hypothetical protein
MSDSKIGAKVRAMLDLADSEEALGHLDTAANHRATAERWMVKYRIEQEEAVAIDPASANPIQVDLDLVGYGSKYKSMYHTMWYHIARHCEVRSWEEYSYTEGGYVLRTHVVGYEEDVRYAEMLFTAARLVFQEKLEPRIDHALGDQVNVYRLRSAGIERVRIAEMMWGNTDKVFLGRVGRLYKAECEQRGEPAMLSGRGVTGKAYREQYAEQFVATLSGRLWAARQAATATGGGLVLHGRKERINEAFYAFYPNQRPKPALPAADEPEPCEKCAKSKRGCREHYIPVGRSSAGPDYNSVAAERGRMAGRAAARDVRLNRNGGREELGS